MEMRARKLVIMLLVLSLSVILYGCPHSSGGGGGSSEGTTTTEGAVTQGAVSGATIYADHLTGSEAKNQTIDADEIYTTSTTTGYFKLPSKPNYEYILVSVGGTDMITGQPAMVMLAGQGSRNVSPFTSMVYMDSSARSMIESLGIRFDDNLNDAITPAAALLIQSIQAIVLETTNALNPGGNKLTLKQKMDLQKTILKRTAAAIKSSSTGSLTDPAALSALLTTALENALTDMTTDPLLDGQITFANINTIAQDIIGPLVTAVADAIMKSTGSTTFGTTGTFREDHLITAESVSAINASMQTIDVSNEVTVTENITNHAPTISGTPASSVLVGAKYDFTATAADDDNDILLFTIQNKPAWASFNYAKGELYGTPTKNDVGTTKDIVISVTDGIKTVSLAAFSITVLPDSSVDSVSVSPVNPSIALGTRQQMTAMAVYSDSSTLDVGGLGAEYVTWSSSDTSVASVDATGNVTSKAKGTTTITATFSGKSGSTTLTVTDPTLSSILVTPTNPSVVKGTTKQFAAMGTYTDNTTQDLTKQVTWASSNEAVATVDVNGLATARSSGSAKITATFGSVSNSTTLTVVDASLVSISIEPANPSIALGLNKKFTAMGTYDNAMVADITASVTWSSSATNVAQISNAAGDIGTAYSKSVGQTTITATLGSVSNATTLSVTAAQLLSLTVAPSTASVAKGLTQAFTVTGTFSDGTTGVQMTDAVAWSSSNTAVASISNVSGAKGVATATKEGITTISATYTDSYGTVTGTASLTVTTAVVASLAISPSNPSIALGTNQTFSAMATYTDSSSYDVTAQATWSSSNNAVATVSNAPGSVGQATPVAVGTVTITATFDGKSANTTLSVTSAKLVSITVSPANASINLGATQQFTATGNYGDGSQQDITALVSWSSSQTGVATVGNLSATKGLATSVSAGQTTITATDATTGKVGSTTLTVNPTPVNLVSLSVSPSATTVALGQTQQFTATGTFSDSHTADITKSVNWTSNDTTRVTIGLNTGLATAMDHGSVIITATDPTTNLKGSSSMTVSAVLRSIAISGVASIIVNESSQFTAKGTYSDGSTKDLTKLGVWTSANMAVATVDAATGVVTAGSSAGNTTILFSYGGMTAQWSLEVAGTGSGSGSGSGSGGNGGTGGF